MRALLMSHSGLRYLVLVALLALIIVSVMGMVSKKPAGKGVRIVGSVFVGLLDLQILLGLVAVIMGVWYPALIGHLVMMVGAAAVAHVTLAMNRRRPVPGYTLPLGGAVAALVLIIGGIMAIQCSPFATGCGQVVRAVMAQ